MRLQTSLRRRWAEGRGRSGGKVFRALGACRIPLLPGVAGVLLGHGLDEQHSPAPSEAHVTQHRVSAAAKRLWHR